VAVPRTVPPMARSQLPCDGVSMLISEWYNRRIGAKGYRGREVNTAWQVTFASKSSADTKAVLRAARAMARNCMISILNFLEWESVVKV